MLQHCGASLSVYFWSINVRNNLILQRCLSCHRYDVQVNECVTTHTRSQVDISSCLALIPFVLVFLYFLIDTTPFFSSVFLPSPYYKIKPVQNITDSIDLRTEYLNYLPLGLTTATDCIRRHLLVNPTIPYHVCVNNKRLSALYISCTVISRGRNHPTTIYGVSVIFAVYFLVTWTTVQPYSNRGRILSCYLSTCMDFT